MKTMSVKEKIKVRVNGREVDVESGTPLGRIFELAGVENALGGRINGRILDLQTPLYESGEVKPIYREDPESLEILRHSLAHILAQALKELFGAEKVHLGVGPPTEEGFYYDVEVEELDRESALSLFEKLKERYKIEIINRIPSGEPVTVYEQGNFVDLCRGPHGAFRLTSVSGAYWMGRADRPQLTRIYGMAFWSEKELRQRIRFYEEARKRDHRKLGRELEFFLIDDSVGAGLVLWLPRGAVYRKGRSADTSNVTGKTCSLPWRWRVRITT